jgi:hypothetical protein
MGFTRVDRQVDFKAGRIGGEHEREEYFLSDAPNAHRNLLVAVLHRAIMDLRTPIQISTSEDRRSAIRWFKSVRRGPWSFVWVCEELDLNPIEIKKASFMWIRKGAETKIEKLVA